MEVPRTLLVDIRGLVRGLNRHRPREVDEFDVKQVLMSVEVSVLGALWARGERQTFFCVYDRGVG